MKTTTKQQSDAALQEYRATVESGAALFYAWRSHAGRRLGGPPVGREAWASCIEWLGRLARQSDAMAQLVQSIGLPPLYQTAGEAAAAVYRGAHSAMQQPYDDVVGRSGPEPGRHRDHVRDWTLRERITALAYLKRATHGFDCTAPGYGWALEALAREQGVVLPEWK